MSKMSYICGNGTGSLAYMVRHLPNKLIGTLGSILQINSPTRIVPKVAAASAKVQQQTLSSPLSLAVSYSRVGGRPTLGI